MISKLHGTIHLMYPLWSFIVAVLFAQAIKPVFYWLKYRKWDFRQIVSAGGFPSSHSAGVSALALATGIQERFSSTLFAITLAFALIVFYDGANVRYFSGINIQLTKRIIEDLRISTDIPLDNHIYESKMKEVLGHKWSEIFGGIVIGLTVSLLVLFIGG